MAANNTTASFNFNLTDFDKIPWHTEQHNNWHVVDALMARFLAISNVKGVWENALAVVVGDRYIDSASDLIYEVLVAHTTPSAGTFAASRLANSNYWQSVTVDVSSKGTYAQATSYSPNDFVQDGGRYGVVQATYTSDNTQATAALSYDADVTAGSIVTLIDVNSVIAATHDTNTVATGGTPTATYTAATNKFDFGLVTGATGATGAAGADFTGDAELNAISGLTSAEDKGIRFTGSGTAEVITITDAATTILDDADVAAIATTLGLGTGSSPQFTGVELGHASDTTITRASSGDLNIEGNIIYRAGGTDVPIADGGTGAGTAADAATALGVGTGDSPHFTAVNLGHASDTTLARSASGIMTIEGAVVKTAGTETIWVPASAMYPCSTNGCDSLAQVETTAQQPEFKVLDFDKDSDEFAQFTVAFPKSWNAGTITYRVYWVGIAATTGVAWTLAGRSVADNAEAIGAFGTAIVIQDDSQGDATEVLITGTSGAVTIANAAADTLTFFQISRDVSDGNDDMAGDARLAGIQIFYTTNATNDA
jgi:hypothetical protein